MGWDYFIIFCWNGMGWFCKTRWLSGFGDWKIMCKNQIPSHVMGFCSWSSISIEPPAEWFRDSSDDLYCSGRWVRSCRSVGPARMAFLSEFFFFKKIPPNLAVLLMKEILHQLRLVVYPGWLFGVSEPSIVFQPLKHEPFSWISFDSLSLS